MLTIRICTPFYSEFESIKPGIRECLEYDKIKFVFEPRQGTYLYSSRNSLLNDGKSQLKKQSAIPGFDYFLFVDSDITFTLDNVLKLISHDKDIIASPYFAHKDNGTYYVGDFYENAPGRIKFNYSKFEKGLKTVGYAGTGFMLIKASVLSVMTYPWFEPMLLDLGECAEVMGEDVSFCVKAKKFCFDVFCDFDNPVGHRLRKVDNFNWDL